MAEQTRMETIKVEGGQLIDQIKRLVHEGNVRRIIIKQEDRTVAEFPRTNLNCRIERKEQAVATEHATSRTLSEKVEEFLAQRRIAVAGISAARETPGNMIYRKLKTAGYKVFAVSPTAETFDGDRCYPDLLSIPGGVDGVVIATRPTVTEDLVHQCVAARVARVWMHESLIHGGTSVSADAVAFCRDHDIALIAGACPLMYCAPVDVGHRCMHWMMRVTGGLPK